MLRALLHLAGQIQRRSYDHVRVCPPDLDFRIETLDIKLGSRERLLADVQAFGQSVDLCRIWNVSSRHTKQGSPMTV